MVTIKSLINVKNIRKLARTYGAANGFAASAFEKDSIWFMLNPTELARNVEELIEDIKKGGVFATGPDMIKNYIGNITEAAPFGPALLALIGGYFAGKLMPNMKIGGLSIKGLVTIARDYGAATLGGIAVGAALHQSSGGRGNPMPSGMRIGAYNYGGY